VVVEILSLVGAREPRRVVGEQGWGLETTAAGEAGVGEDGLENPEGPIAEVELSMDCWKSCSIFLFLI